MFIIELFVLPRLSLGSTKSNIWHVRWLDLIGINQYDDNDNNDDANNNNNNNNSGNNTTTTTNNNNKCVLQTNYVTVKSSYRTVISKHYFLANTKIHYATGGYNIIFCENILQ